ncbi:hypothetical protein [Methanobrevibacter sp.]|uniref:hypothetical protein n=1 Tax=Methanobrevibacter sp. TaxID=66852 RepID=UPI00388EE70A
MSSKDVYMGCLKQKRSNIDESEYLKESGELNTTTSGIYGSDVLNVMKDWTNLTCWR